METHSASADAKGLSVYFTFFDWVTRSNPSALMDEMLALLEITLLSTFRTTVFGTVTWGLPHQAGEHKVRKPRELARRADALYSSRNMRCFKARTRSMTTTYRPTAGQKETKSGDPNTGIPDSK